MKNTSKVDCIMESFSNTGLIWQGIVTLLESLTYKNMNQVKRCTNDWGEWLTITFTVLTLIPTSCVLSWVNELTKVTTLDSPGNNTTAERVDADLEFGYTSSRLKVIFWTELSSELSEAISAFIAVWVTWAADEIDSNNLYVNHWWKLVYRIHLTLTF